MKILAPLILLGALTNATFADEPRPPSFIITGVYALAVCDMIQGLMFVYQDGHVDMMPPEPSIIGAVVRGLPKEMRHLVTLQPADGCPVEPTEPAK